MPLGRYFGFVDGLLLILLFVADWYFPNRVSGKQARGIERLLSGLRRRTDSLIESFSTRTSQLLLLLATSLWPKFHLCVYRKP
jgi:hypothetical protein